MPSVTSSWSFVNGGRFDYSTNPIIAGANNKIYFQCQGIRINANVTVTNLTSVNNPTLFTKAKMSLPTLMSGPVQTGTVHEIGIVQILEYSRMEATYKENTASTFGRFTNKTTQYWSQAVTPCYDCQTNDIPWYDPVNGKAVVTQGSTCALSINDFPQLNVSPYLDRPGHGNDGQPLLGVIKHNKFSVYLLLRETLGGQTTNKWVLKGGTWEVKSEWKTNAQWATNIYNANGYTQIADSLVYDENCTFSSTAFFGLPERGSKIDADKGSKQGANDNQTDGFLMTTPLTYWSFEK